jgi:hypothetical protein
MRSHGSPMGLMGLRPMVVSPISPTTLGVGLMGLTKLDSPLWTCKSLFTPVLTGYSAEGESSPVSEKMAERKQMFATKRREYRVWT